MKSLSEFYGAHAKRGDVGIEIECESDNELPEIAGKGWVSHKDPSLRGFSKEYVTSNPIVISCVGEYLDNLNRQLKDHKILDSFRTSVHVHKNMLRYSPLQIWNGVCAYWILEELLFNYCGEHRKQNTFCLRLRDAEAVLDACLYDISLDYPFKSFKDNDTIRYGGINLAALRRFGTVEFRGMRGTTDAEIIKTWVTDLSGLIDTAAVQFDSPEQLLDTYYVEDKEKFISRFLSFNLTEALFKADPKWKDTIQAGAERILPLAYTCDWMKWSKKMDEALEKKVYDGKISTEPEPRPRPINRGRRGVQWEAVAVQEVYFDEVEY